MVQRGDGGYESRPYILIRAMIESREVIGLVNFARYIVGICTVSQKWCGCKQAWGCISHSLESRLGPRFCGGLGSGGQDELRRLYSYADGTVRQRIFTLVDMKGSE